MHLKYIVKCKIKVWVSCFKMALSWVKILKAISHFTQSYIWYSSLQAAQLHRCQC